MIGYARCGRRLDRLGRTRPAGRTRPKDKEEHNDAGQDADDGGSGSSRSKVLDRV